MTDVAEMPHNLPAFAATHTFAAYGRPLMPEPIDPTAFLEAETLIERIDLDVATLRRECGFTSPRRLLERATIVLHGNCPGCSVCQSPNFKQAIARSSPVGERTHHSDMAAVLIHLAQVDTAHAREALRVQDVLTAHRYLNAAQRVLLGAAGHRFGIGLGESEKAIGLATTAARSDTARKAARARHEKPPNRVVLKKRAPRWGCRSIPPEKRSRTLPSQ
jgi:hypothetical protein